MVEKYFTERDYAEGTAAKHFFFSSIVMLNIGVFLALGTSMRLAWPDIFPNDIAWLHFGRIRPVHVHFVIFGWISMAFAGAMCYMTPALCKTRLWSEKLGVWNCWAWNVGMVFVFFTLINGMTTGREYQDLIWPIDAYILLFVFAPLAINIWMTMFRRKAQGLYVTLWFFGAALLFILLSYFIGAVPDFFPVTGLSEAYMTWWHAHNILGLWITPVSAAIAYYIIPKVSGNTLYSHKIGHLHFWSIAAFYSTPGAHHLMGAPIPEWLKSFASVSGVLIMIPALAFVVNMLMTMKDKWWMFTRSIPLQWALTGVLFAIPLNIQGGVPADPRAQLVHPRDPLDRGACPPGAARILDVHRDRCHLLRSAEAAQARALQQEAGAAPLLDDVDRLPGLLGGAHRGGTGAGGGQGVRDSLHPVRDCHPSVHGRAGAVRLAHHLLAADLPLQHVDDGEVRQEDRARDRRPCARAGGGVNER